MDGQQLTLYAVLLVALGSFLTWLVREGFPKFVAHRFKEVEEDSEHERTMETMQARNAQSQLTIALNKAIGTDERLIAEASSANEFMRETMQTQLAELKEEIQTLRKYMKEDSQKQVQAVVQLRAETTDMMHELQQWMLERDAGIDKKLATIETSVGWASQLMPFLSNLVDEKK